MQFSNLPVYHFIRVPIFSRSFYFFSFILFSWFKSCYAFIHMSYLHLFYSKAMTYFNVNYNIAIMCYYASQSLARPSCLIYYTFGALDSRSLVPSGSPWCWLWSHRFFQVCYAEDVV